MPVIQWLTILRSRFSNAVNSRTMKFAAAVVAFLADYDNFGFLYLERCADEASLPATLSLIFSAVCKVYHSNAHVRKLERPSTLLELLK